MVRYIEEKEMMTYREACEKYEKFYIGFVETEQNFTDPDNARGYVVCVMDEYDEGFTIPRRTEDGMFISVMPGYSVGGTEMGIIILEGV